MTLPVEELEHQALNLPTEERARLLERLLESLEPESEVQAAWIQIAQQRRDEVLSGKVQLVPGDEALARIRARLS
ncbi:addiction module protein [Marinospirillum sp.]|uniref:addiction module protein n=1 Tax=Marinospirillum sp. TaxID=2183934 RepID=UPI00286FE542|nr:addiction module protein [Marinospirillum sp.]MDR9469227.1 addiction module protein [Marinospirillum sp.]